MDSNRKYIDPNKFWNGHKVKKIKAGNIEEAFEVANHYEFCDSRYIIIHIGTNDTEISSNAAEISKGIINVANNLRRMYPKAKIFVSQIPPRNDTRNWICQNVNNLLKNILPESLYLIDNSNINANMLYDKKHINRKDIGRLVYNMKKAIRNNLNGEYNDKATDKYSKNYYENYSKRKANIEKDNRINIDKSKFLQMVDTMKEMMNGRRNVYW